MVGHNGRKRGVSETQIPCVSVSGKKVIGELGTIMDKDEQYTALMATWSSGVIAYHSLFSAYLTASSIFVAASVFLLNAFFSNGGETMIAFFLVFIGVIGVFTSFQMAVGLERFTGQNQYFEWELRGIEAAEQFGGVKLFQNLHSWRERQREIENKALEPPKYKPNWATKIHRFKLAARAKAFPWIFGLYFIVIIAFIFLDQFEIIRFA